MAKLYSGLLVPTAVTATSAATGYDATNVRVPSIELPWRAANVSAHDVTLDFGSAKSIVAIAVNGCNFASASVLTGATLGGLAARGTLNTSKDRHGRRRGILVFAQTHQYLRLSFNGTPTDGAAYWWIGAAYAMGVVDNIVGPSWGYEPKTKKPGIVSMLPNGLTTKAASGPYRDMINFTWEPRTSELVTPVMDLPDRETCVLDMELSAYPWQVWPVRSVEEEVTESFAALAQGRIQKTLMELC